MVRLHWRAGTKRALRGVDLSVVLSIVLWVGLNAPLAGWVRPDELPERYAVADVFAGPSVEDELGRAFVRANFSWQSMAERYAKILGI